MTDELRLPLIDNAEESPWRARTPSEVGAPAETTVYEYDPDGVRLYLHTVDVEPAPDVPIATVATPEPFTSAEDDAELVVTVDGRASEFVDGVAASASLTTETALHRVATNVAITVHALTTVAQEVTAAEAAAAADAADDGDDDEDDDDEDDDDEDDDGDNVSVPEPRPFDMTRLEASNILAEAVGEVSVPERIARDRAVAEADADGGDV